MKLHIRFKKSFDAYQAGKSYFLPDDIASIYIKAGVAEQVDFVPQPVEPEPVPAETVTDDADDGAEPVTAPKRKRS